MIKKDKAFSEDLDPETSRRLYIDYDSHGNESLVSKNKTVSSKSKSRESAESTKPLMAYTPFRTSVSKKKGNSIKVNKTSSSLISNGGSYVTVYQKRMASKRKNAPPSSSTSKVNLNVNWTCDRLVQPSFKVVDIRGAEVESSAQNLRSQGDFRIPKRNCNLINKTNYNRVHSKKYKISQGSSSKVDLEECKSKANHNELTLLNETCINGMSLPSPLRKILSRLSSRDVVVESFCPRDVIKETLKGLSLENTLVSETPVPTSKIIYSSKGEPPKVENANCETFQCRKNDSTHSNIFVDLKNQLKILSSNPSIPPEKRRVLLKLSVTNAELFNSNSVPSKNMNNYNSEEVHPTKPRKERTGDLYDFLYS
ncbi:hypothetical protein QYM36_007980 [Artemia franciscana]|uniref:Uncharacterized protein n=1 Tax=Artemia franciscana TaxID=6661 RepID=A0AA88ITT0_ARTSF|nr:hypothetical protein QYM36_007980 [Artemia franciscana]